MSNTANVMELMEKYAPATPQGDKKEPNPNRVILGKVFIQPTGGKGTKPFNYSYGYFGILDATGNFVAGFSMSNKAMLESVSAGALSEDFTKCFAAYAEKFAAEGHVVLK